MLYSDLNEGLILIEKAVLNYPNTDLQILKEIRELKLTKAQLKEQLYGDELRAKYEFESAPSFTSRLGLLEYQLSENTTAVSATHRATLQMVEKEYGQFKELLAAYQKRIEELQRTLEKSNIPYTKYRLNWKED